MVCHGNICRSPMAERVARAQAAERGLEVEITSAGVSDEEHGGPIDPRAARVLKAAGYDTSNHRAHQITAREIQEADLVVAAEQYHVDRMRRLVPEADNLHLFSEYDPEASPGDGLPDPWYGGMDGFHATLAAIERAVPRILDEVER
ncbi:MULTISPECIES: low molecular weight protein-tyrosine-phosphatase [unclassified Luteococcus]|uniref:low molecular weight protein-tyrosine-phosphatase n=1 Tax=unclassified Luteococcus TaxID=2639923 RepID=UPI00313C1265